MIRRLTLLLLLALCCGAAWGQHSFTSGNGTFLLDGKPFVVKAAELHFPRIPKPYWDHRIKMCKALGMNTVCLYVFWNYHEDAPDVLNFSGERDVAEFCRLVQANGMYVILRPGPYVCAEWEMGGLPWWLLRKKDIALREPDDYFMERVSKFEHRLGKELAGLTIDKGGPIIMVQVENEYGSYGTNKGYVSQVRDILRSAGFDKVMLFQCDWSSNFEQNGLDDMLWTLNFGTGANLEEQFRRLDELRPDAPKMCSEFWSGWFDKWGAAHETRPAEAMVEGIDEMLAKGISFSLYMTHGGTSFGHWAGANSPGFAPDVTSYDYDAPIAENGTATPKYWLLRSTMQKHAEQPLDEPPEPPMPIINVPQFSLNEFAHFTKGIERTTRSHTPATMEELGMGYGSVLYSTTLPALEHGGVLTVAGCHDYAIVALDGTTVGRIDRVKNEHELTLPPCPRGAKLEILVEAMGRINFGRAIKDHKGLTGEVTIATGDATGERVLTTLNDWEMSLLPDSYSRCEAAFGGSSPTIATRSFATAGYYRGTFCLDSVGDTFLNTSRLGKGLLYVNGHAIGRFWNIGPQQALYVPGCWLTKGENEVIALDVEGPEQPVMWGQDKPENNQLRPQRDNTRATTAQRPETNKMQLLAQAEIEAGNGWKTLPFAGTATARWVAIECLDTHNAGEAPAIAEIYLLDSNGSRIDRENWTVAYADSEDKESGNHNAEKLFDLQESTFWCAKREAGMPQMIVIDLNGKHQIAALQLLPRAEQNAPGSVKVLRVLATDELTRNNL